MEKVLDHFGNEIHVGDYVVSTTSFGHYWSGFTYVYKVVDLKYENLNDEYYVIVKKLFPLEERNQTDEFEARHCLVTTRHNYINSQKSVLQRTRDERKKQNEEKETGEQIRRRLSGLGEAKDWQRPYWPCYYYDKKVNDWVLNHPNPRKTRKKNRLVICKDAHIPSKPTTHLVWNDDGTCRWTHDDIINKDKPIGLVPAPVDKNTPRGAYTW